jgi:hypothetical protein
MPLMISPWKVVKPPFGEFEATANRNSDHVFKSIITSEKDSFLKVLSQYQSLCIAPSRTFSDKSSAFSGLSGSNKKMATPNEVVTAPQK